MLNLLLILGIGLAGVSVILGSYINFQNMCKEQDYVDKIVRR